MNPARSLPKIKILVIDDVEEMRELMKAMCEEIDGVAVSGTAANTWDARLELSRRRPSVVLLDEVLPGESSLDLLQELREAGLPVLLVTGMQDRKEPLPEGAYARLEKPGWKSLDEDRKRFERLIREAYEAHRAARPPG